MIKMKLEEIEALWAEDCKLDRSQLDMESLRIPELHQKYYKIYTREKMALKAEENDFATFLNTKTEYYLGLLDQQTLEQHGWEQFQLSILKGDVPRYIDADREIQLKRLKIHLQREKVEFLQSIIETINRRGFIIKNAIDYLKFTNGGH